MRAHRAPRAPIAPAPADGSIARASRLASSLREDPTGAPAASRSTPALKAPRSGRRAPADAGELDPGGDPPAVGLVEGRRHGDQRNRVLGQELGANPDDQQAEQRPIARGRGGARRVVLAGLERSCPARAALRTALASCSRPEVECARPPAVDEDLVRAIAVRGSRPRAASAGSAQQSQPSTGAFSSTSLTVIGRPSSVRAQKARSVERTAHDLRKPVDPSRVSPAPYLARPNPDVHGLGVGTPARQGGVRAPRRRGGCGDEPSRRPEDSGQRATRDGPSGARCAGEAGRRHLTPRVGARGNARAARCGRPAS